MSATKDEMLLALADTCAGRGWTGHLAEFDAIRDLIERSGDDKPGCPTAEEVEVAFKRMADAIYEGYMGRCNHFGCISASQDEVRDRQALDVLRRAIGVTVKE